MDYSPQKAQNVRANSHFTIEIPIYLKIYPTIFRAPSARRIFNDATNCSSDSRKVEWRFYFCLQILESEWGCLMLTIISAQISFPAYFIPNPVDECISCLFCPKPDDSKRNFGVPNLEVSSR